MKRCFFLAAALFAAAHAGSAVAQVRIVTTTANLAAIATAVGGPDVRVHALTRGTRDPHYAAAKPSMIRKIFDADLLLVVGADLEVGWLPAALQTARNAKVLPGRSGYVDLTTAVEMLEVPTGTVTRAMGDVHVKGNPHYLLDPRNGALVAAVIAERLARIDAARAADYKARSVAFATEIEKRMKNWRSRLAPLAGKRAISYHKTFTYFAAAFDIKMVGEVEPLPGISPTAAHLADLLQRIKSEQIGLLMMATYYERRSARYLSDATGITVAVLPQAVGAREGIETYFDLFDGMVAELDRVGAI